MAVSQTQKAQFSAIDPGIIAFLVISARIVALLPLALGALIAVITPTYFRPMLSSQAGLTMLAVGAACVAGGYAFMEVAIRLMRRRHLVVGILLVLLSFLILLVTVWIILLGPALLILSTTPQPGQ